ncbi:MAG TPA: 2-phospho-L-lactate transferase [Anaerolineae bacterium]|nr:2-phospho-L-lactate transferase [Anaerolineae bacterium]
MAGGVGGAKLADGLARVLPPENLTIIGNTGDDFVHLGLTICPDLDTVMYTLSDLASKQRGWGLEGETWRTLERVKELGGPDWFNLGDLDLATHLIRSHMLANGATLTEATAHLCQHVGIKTTLLPMCDAPVPTLVETEQGTLGFQEWFVKAGWQPQVNKVLLPDSARATAAVVAALNSADIILLAPSNPFVSIDPILNCYPIRPMIADTKNVVIAVSPIIAGDAVKGPSAEMMRHWGMPVSAQAIAEYYTDLLTGFVYDNRDADVPQLGDLPLATCDTLMKSAEDRIRVAQFVLQFAQELGNF